jgi:hypothetical protein
MRTTLTLLVATWALLVLPSLCHGGWVNDSSDCPESVLCTHARVRDADWCTRIYTAPEPSQSDEVAHTGIDLDRHIRTALTEPSGEVRDGSESDRGNRSTRLPFPPSDLPLLI